jgi:uncharacterized protein
MIKIDVTYLRKAIMLLPAVPLLAFSISLTLFANLGSDVYTSFQQGVALRCGADVGTVNTVFSICILIGFLFIDRSLVNIGSLFMCAGIGPFMTLFGHLLRTLISGPMTLWPRVALLCVGTLIGSIALSWYIQINLGVQPMDMLIVTIAKVSRKTYGIAVYIFDALMLLGTLLMGGTLGLGTIVNILCTGKLVDIIMPRLKPVIDTFSLGKQL